MTLKQLAVYVLKNTFDLVYYALIIAILMLPCWGTLVLNAWVSQFFK